MITVSCLARFYSLAAGSLPSLLRWTLTHFFPSVILIPLGFWVIFDGIRYETIFGRILLPGVGTALLAIGMRSPLSRWSTS